ncbi:efflux RND transporter permease subunit [Criibacterium bergeronii]|uniref:Antibiotic ABC transporter permease n=1 Tax=Criibacterium bergeronii TaxID=1871336 RepID=A0A371IKF7_9FIRM|nr:MMPL family transporter [Criibacterium bergeronii]MBS6062836.1 MMPL family transporter [Peptostreptococcaceae bacterium]RDY20978.1 antibiotic ABC transporter permease [Criibacterium bergeronii]
MLHLFAKYISNHAKVIVLLSFLLVLPCIYGAAMTRVNYDVLSYLPKDKESVIAENVLERDFKLAATTFLMIDNMPQSDVASLAKKIKQIPAVNDVIYLRDFVGSGIPKDFLPKEITDNFYSQNGEMLMVKYEEKAASESTMEAIATMKTYMNEQCFMSGLSVLLKDIKMLILREMPIYIMLAGALSLVVLQLCIESYVLPFIFMLSIGLGIIYNFGTNIIFGEISYITQAIAAILQLAVTVDYAIFVVHRYDEEKEKCNNSKLAMENAIVGAFLSLAGSSLTTIAGFGSLCFMGFTIGIDLGLVMMKGVVIGVLTCVTFLPAAILLLDDKIKKYTHKSLIPSTDNLTDRVFKRRKLAVLFILIMMLPAYYMQSHVPVYYNISQSLPKTIDANIGKNKLENDFGMSDSHIIVMSDDIPASDMIIFFKKLEKIDGVKTVLGYQKIIGKGIPDSFIPDSIKDIFKKDGKQTIIINSMYATATDESNEQIDKINQLAKSYDPNAMVTGEAALTKDLSITVNKDIQITNIISVISIFIIVALVFKSLLIPVILVLCIEFAIFINMSIPFITANEVSFVTPIVIGAIQLGATVDYSILLTTRFTEELSNGLNAKDAVRIATTASSKSIITSVLVFLSATSGVIFVSSIDIIKGICITLARGSVISGLVIIFILPPILYLYQTFMEKIRPSKTVNVNLGE